MGLANYVGTPEEREQKLRRLESAAASAILTGCTEDEVRARFEAGVADGHRLRGPQPLRPLLPSPPRQPGEPSASPALDRLCAAYGV